MSQPRIQLMSPLLANQIAAGEVVERPASVVKELLENCLDAGATQIHIDLERCGIERIRIRDDGYGIVKDDLLLAVSRHATSKVLKPEDLQAIDSLGFRGEALASIAAVAKVQVTSKAQIAEHAWCLQYEPLEGSHVLEPAAHPQGTTIDVNQLFFNVPARRKFLRSDRTELSHIETIVKQIALSRHDIQIILKHQQITLLSVRKAEQPQQIKQRIAAICGQPFMDSALEINFTDDVIRLHGWLGQADSARTQTDTQYFYVNGRAVRDKLLNHAIKMAYHDLIPEGRFPCYVLYLDLPPDAIDVNVHPTKHEVRFYDARQIHDFVAFHLDRALHGSALHNTPSESPSAQDEMQYLQSNFSTEAALTIQEPQAHYHVAWPIRESLDTVNEKSIAHVIENLPITSPETDTTTSSINNKSATSLQQNFKIIGSAKNNYLLIETTDALALVNIERTQQAIAYESMLQAIHQQPLTSQPLLLPTAFTLSSAQSETLENKQHTLATFGIQLMRATEQRWLLRGIPKILRNLDIINSIIHFTDNKNESTHEQVCLQFVKQSKLATSFTLPNNAQHEMAHSLFALNNWHHHILKPCRLINWSE